jgi:hypothetical protein
MIVRSIPSFYEQLVRDALRLRAEDFHADRQEDEDVVELTLQKHPLRPGRRFPYECSNRAYVMHS